MGEPRWVPLGRIGRAHGVRGAVKIHPYGDTLATREPGTVVYLRLPGKPATQLTVLSMQRQPRVCIGQFAEITSRSDALELAGEEIFLPENLLPPTEEGEYYHFQLLGLTVETSTGIVLGVLQHILPTGSNDVYVVDYHGREVLIPAIAEVVHSIDLERARMVVELPEGLIDDL
jgi:16S rRNA processing protein RimM